MTSFSVFLDTSSLPRHPDRLGMRFQRLCDLSRIGVVKIFFSEVVLNEWASQMKEEFENTINQGHTSIKQVLSHSWSEGIQDINVIKEVEKILTDAKANTHDISNEKVQELIKMMDAEVLSVEDHHGRHVIISYFVGEPPFKKIKNREDFPDAFIFQCAKDLIKKLNDKLLHCIIADKGLNKTISSIDGTFLYRSIHEFVKSKEICEAIKGLDRELAWQEYFRHTKQALSKLSKKIKGELEYLIDEKLPYAPIHHGDIPSDDGEAMITGVYDLTEIKFDWNNIDDFGPGAVLVPFSFTCEANVEFPIYHGNAYSVPEGVKVHYGDHEADYCFDAEGTLKLYVEGLTAININIDFTDSNKALKFEDLTIDIEEIEEKQILTRDDFSIFI